MPFLGPSVCKARVPGRHSRFRCELLALTLDLSIVTAFVPVPQHLRKEEQNDDNLVDLAHNMNHTLTFVALVKDRAEIEKLQSIVKEMMELVRNTSHFIIDYFCCRRLGMCSAIRGGLSGLIFHFP